MGVTYTPTAAKKGEFTMNHSVMEMKDHSLVIRLMYHAIRLVIHRRGGGKAGRETPEYQMMLISAVCSPLRNLQICSGIKGGIMPGLLEMANGHFFRGLRKMITG